MSVAAPAVLISGHDSKKWSETSSVDPVVDFESEGGWRMSRPRFTRRPPKVFTLGFTDISNAEKEAIEQLYDDCRGSSEIISGWKHPISDATIPVRFKKGVMPKFTYTGYENNHRWDVSNVELEEV